MIKYNVVMCCYDKILVNVAAYVIVCYVWVCVCVCVCVFGAVQSKQEPVYSAPNTFQYSNNST